MKDFWTHSFVNQSWSPGLIQTTFQSFDARAHKNKYYIMVLWELQQNY